MLPHSSRLTSLVTACVASLALLATGCSLAQDQTDAVPGNAVGDDEGAVADAVVDLDAYCDELAIVLERQAGLGDLGPDAGDARIESLEAFGEALLTAADQAPEAQATILDRYAVANVQLIAAVRNGADLGPAQGTNNRFFFTEMQPIYGFAEDECEFAEMAMPEESDAPPAPAPGEDDAVAGREVPPEPLVVPDVFPPVDSFFCAPAPGGMLLVDVVNGGEVISDLELDARLLGAGGDEVRQTAVLIKGLQPGERTVEIVPGGDADAVACEPSATEVFELSGSTDLADVVSCVLTPDPSPPNTTARVTFENFSDDDASYQFTIAFIGTDGVRRAAFVATTGLAGPRERINESVVGPPVFSGAATCVIVEAFRVTPG